jgi:hypothetical protein
MLEAQLDALLSSVALLKSEIIETQHNLRTTLDALMGGDFSAAPMPLAAATSGLLSVTGSSAIATETDALPDAPSDPLFEDIKLLKIELTETASDLRTALAATLKEQMEWAELLLRQRQPGRLTFEEGASVLAQAVLIAQTRSSGRW